MPTVEEINKNIVQNSTDMFTVNCPEEKGSTFLELLIKERDIFSISTKLHHCLPAQLWVTSSFYNESKKGVMSYPTSHSS